MSNIWNMVFPNRCIFCGSLMPVKEHAICCGRCRNTLPIIRGDVCFKCGHEKEFCECLEANNTYDAVVAPFYFHGKVRSAIHAFKFNMRTQMQSLWPERWRAVRPDTTEVFRLTL